MFACLRVYMHPLWWAVPTKGLPAYLGRLEAHACPLGGGEVHSLRDAVAAAHFGHKGSWEADDELAALLHGPVHLDPLSAQHLRGDLGRQARAERHSLRDCAQPLSCPHCLSPFCGSPSTSLTHSRCVAVHTCPPAGRQELRRGLFTRRQIRFGSEDFFVSPIKKDV